MKPVKRSFPKRFVAAVLASAALTSGLVVMLPGFIHPVGAQEAVLRTLTVTGQGQESVQTTKALVVLGVEQQGRDATTVQEAIAERSTAVVELLRSRQVDKLETTGVRLNPQYNYDNGQAEIIGYSGSNTVSFEMPTEAVGTLLDEAVNAGANEIISISFIAEDDTIAAARQQALREATADAQAQANTVLSALDLGPQEIIGIQINGASAPIPINLPQRAEFSVAQADVSTPVIGGEQSVQATVTLQIRY